MEAGHGLGDFVGMFVFVSGFMFCWRPSFRLHCEKIKNPQLYRAVGGRFWLLEESSIRQKRHGPEAYDGLGDDCDVNDVDEVHRFVVHTK